MKREDGALLVAVLGLVACRTGLEWMSRCNPWPGRVHALMGLVGVVAGFAVLVSGNRKAAK